MHPEPEEGAGPWKGGGEDEGRTMERPNAWRDFTPEQLAELDEFCEGYRVFISENKTERECVSAAIRLAREAGYVDLNDAIASGEKLVPGSKVYANNHGKTLMLVHIGTNPLEDGTNILGAHIDSPRLDIKQNPIAESNGIVTLDTHYYGAIKKYQWLAHPLAIHGVVAKKDGTVVNVCIGEREDDPVFCISDLLPHLGAQQMAKKASEVIDGELLDVIVGNRPADACEKCEDPASDANCKTDGQDGGKEDDGEKKDSAKDRVISVLLDTYGIEEEDLLSAELEVVPAGPARDMGLDRSMILGYGHDDRSCAYPSLIAQLECEAPARTSVTLLVDKEEIGSVGATGMRSRFFEDSMAEVLALAGADGPLSLRRCLRNSRMLSSDVSAAYDPAFASVYEPKNSSYMGHGLSFNKYTGARGKGMSNDANAEYVAFVRDIMDAEGVHFQTCEVGRVDAGGGGTIAFILANYGMNVIDCGVPVLSMHAPWEVANKADIYEAYRGYKAFLRHA